MAERYPAAAQSDVVDDYYGEKVPDPYRGLENADSPETVAFVAAQNELTEEFVAAVASREAIRARLGELWDHLRVGVPFERGGRWFQLRNPGLANQPVLYVMSSPLDEGRVLLDGNSLSGDGTVAVTALEPSEDGSKLAYATSEGGSDWRTFHVRDVETGLDDPDELRWSKYGSAAWRHDGSGFYYGTLDEPTAGAELQQENRFPKVMFHRLGTEQAQDELVFHSPEEPEWLSYATVSEDGRFVVISTERGTFPESRLHILDLEQPEEGVLPLVDDFDWRVLVAANIGRTFFLVTDHGADRQRVVAVDLDSPARENWREVVPESADTLQWAWCYGGRLVAHYLRDAHSVLRVFDLAGTHLHDVAFPPLSSLAAGPLEHGSLEGRRESDIVMFKAVSFTEPGAVWEHDLGAGETRLVIPSAVPVDGESLVTEQVFVTSDDGTRVPMFITRRRDVSPTGEVPVLLYGYGGFGIPMTPSFSVSQVVWVERGGLLAIACLRGGGEFGQAWHDAGRLAHKQNVFDDFSACARWLVDSGWSRVSRIGIDGGSNGGLLVGASITQHPELFGAAVAEVGVLDMLRYNLFTIGWAWTSDFGDPADPEQYAWLRSYSPLHNVVEGRSYPATMLMTGDHDDRVVPGHTLKFAATLQQAQGGEAPILLRVETAAGHGLGKPTDKQIAERTDFLAFLEAALGVAG
jgi:prolyl oligopeptidase